MRSDRTRRRSLRPGRLSPKDRRLLKMILVIFISFLVCYLPITLVKVGYIYNIYIYDCIFMLYCMLYEHSLALQRLGYCTLLDPSVYRCHVYCRYSMTPRCICSRCLATSSSTSPPASTPSSMSSCPASTGIPCSSSTFY